MRKANVAGPFLARSTNVGPGGRRLWSQYLSGCGARNALATAGVWSGPMSTSSRRTITHSIERQIESIFEERTGRACRSCLLAGSQCTPPSVSYFVRASDTHVATRGRHRFSARGAGLPGDGTDLSRRREHRRRGHSRWHLDNPRRGADGKYVRTAGPGCRAQTAMRNIRQRADRGRGSCIADRC